MQVAGLKYVVRDAYEAKKFVTDGRTLPKIDFEAPLQVEISALDKLKLVAVARFSNDEVIDFGKEFARAVYVQMNSHGEHEQAVMTIVNQVPELAELFKDTTKLRISISGFTPVDREPVKLSVVTQPDLHKNVQHRKLVIEHRALIAEAY